MADRSSLALVLALLNNLPRVSTFDWTKDGENSFSAIFSNVRIQVSEKSVLGQGAPDYEVVLLTKEGNAIFSVSDYDLYDVMERAFAAMRDLYLTARAKGMNADREVGAVLAELGVDLDSALSDVDSRRKARLPKIEAIIKDGEDT